jgi:hypothetical protein
MIVHPRLNQHVLIWYNKKRAPFMPLHGLTGRVVVRSRGPGPRNHGVNVGGVVYVVPCGNLQTIKQENKS